MSHHLRTYQGISPNLGKNVYIDPQACVIGNVSLGDDCSVWPMAVIRGDMHQITIGQGCSIQDGAVLHITHASNYNPGGYPLTLGDYVTVGHQASLHGCTIGNHVLIGIGAKVMDGAVIEDNVLLGSGALVPQGKTLKSGYLYIGSPAKTARALSEKELNFLQYSPQNYIKLKNKFLKENY